MRLLIATSNSDTRFSVELLLSQEPGTHVIGTAGDTEGMLALISSTHPDMIIADWALPGQPMPGVLRRFRNSPQKFIILSNQDNVRDNAIAAGASGFVITGSRPEMLQAAYREVRHQSQTSQRSEIVDEQNQQ
jgi:DNA-binding NarL/FixJ family response regulator